MPTDVQCLLQLHDELDLSPDEFLSHLQLNMNRKFLHDAQSVTTAWRSLPLNIISKLEEKFFPQWGRFKNPEKDHQQPYNTGSKTTKRAIACAYSHAMAVTTTPLNIYTSING